MIVSPVEILGDILPLSHSDRRPCVRRLEDCSIFWHGDCEVNCTKCGICPSDSDAASRQAQLLHTEHHAVVKVV